MWTDRDRTLVHALTLYRRGLCPECGRPIAVCEATSFEVETRVCRASAAVETWREQNPKPAPGTRVSTVAMTEQAVSETLATAPDWWLEQHGTTDD